MKLVYLQCVQPAYALAAVLVKESQEVAGSKLQERQVVSVFVFSDTTQ